VNREPMLDVIRMHREAMRGVKPKHVQTELYLGAQEAWDNALERGEKSGYKNSQVTVLAPTCSECGMLMVPNGACYKCENCGSTSGCS